MKFIIPYVLIFVVFLAFLFSIVYFTPYSMEDFKDELYTGLFRGLFFGSLIFFYYILYRLCYKTMSKIISRFGVMDIDEYAGNENESKRSFGEFAFNCFGITIGFAICLVLISFVVFFWYYSVGVISFIFLFILDNKYIKGLLFVLLIIFLITMYQYRNSLLHG